MAFFLPLILDSKKYKSEIVSQIPPIPTAQGKSSQSIKNSNADAGVLVIDLDGKSNPDSEKSSESKVNQKSEQGSKAQLNSDVGNKNLAKVEDNTAETKKDNQITASNSVSAEKTDVQTVIVQPPKVKTETKSSLTEPKAAENAAKPDSKSSLVPKDNGKSKAKLEAVTSDSPDFKETAYVIQIGSFSNKDNATKLVIDLRKNDYRAYQRVSKDFARVFVGPYPDKDIADSRSQALAGIVGSSVKVIEFDPIKH